MVNNFVSERRLLQAVLRQLETTSPADILYEYHFGALAGTYPRELCTLIDILESSLITRTENGEDMDAVSCELGVVAVVFMALNSVRSMPETCELSQPQDDAAQRILGNWKPDINND
jgi:hypothetical protein